MLKSTEQESIRPNESLVDFADRLFGWQRRKTENLPRHHKVKPHNWRPKPHAWLQDGELRTTGVFADLAAEIVRLTTNDLALQSRLLFDHCDLYGPLHFWVLVDAWQKRVKALRRDYRLSKEDAEARAAKECHLLAWRFELRQGTVH